MAFDEQRFQIAELLTRRCNNCYSLLPGYNVHGANWHWLGSNVGPFCDECWEYVLAECVIKSESK